MDAQVIAAIITGIFGIAAGVIVAKFDTFVMIFRKSNRELKEDWFGQMSRYGIEDHSAVIKSTNKCEARLRQQGLKVTGQMTVHFTDTTAGEQAKKLVFQIKGSLEGDYLKCNLIEDQKYSTRFRQILFYVHTSGT